MFVHIRQTDPCNQSWPHCYCSCWCWCLHCCCVCCCTAAFLKQLPSQGGKSDWEGLHFAHQIILLGKKKSSLAKNSSLAREEEKSLEEVASWGNAIQLEEQRDRLRSWTDLRKFPKFWLIFSLNGPFVFLRVFAVFLCVFAVVVWLCRTRRWVCWMSDERVRSPTCVTDVIKYGNHQNTTWRNACIHKNLRNSERKSPRITGQEIWICEKWRGVKGWRVQDVRGWRGSDLPAIGVTSVCHNFCLRGHATFSQHWW